MIDVLPLQHSVDVFFFFFFFTLCEKSVTVVHLIEMLETGKSASDSLYI